MVSRMFRSFSLGLALACATTGVAFAAPSPRDTAKALIAEVAKTQAAKGPARDALAEAERALVLDPSSVDAKRLRDRAIPKS